jgi:hypothetical protein
VTVVKISSSSEPWRRWSADVDDAGVAIIRGLPPSTYSVRVRFPSGANAEIPVAVSASEMVSIEATPGPGTSGAPTLQVVDRARLGQGVDFRRPQLRDLPDAGTLSALLDTTAPFVIADRFDNGGLAVASPPRVGGRGASWTYLSVFLGAMDAGAGPERGNALTSDVNALEGIALTSGLASPEVTAPGPAIILVPRRPGATRQGAVDLSLTSRGMTSVNDQPGAPSIARLNSWTNGGAQFGGPLRDRLGIFLSGSTSSIARDERGQPVSPDARLDTFNGHIVANPGDRSEVRGLVAFQNIDRELDGRAQFRDRNIGEHDTWWQSQLAWDRLSREGSRTQISIAYQHGTATPELGSAIGGAVDRVADGTVPGPAADRTSDRIQAGVVFGPHELKGRFGGHDVRLGLTFARTAWTAQVLAAPPVAELIDGLPARVWIPSIPDVESRRHATDVAGYIADRLSLGRRLSVDLGLRAGFSSGSAAGAAENVSWPAILPRVSFRWAPSALTIFGGFGRYQPELSPDVLAFGDPGEPIAQVYRWTDANGNGQFDPGERGVLIAQAGRGQTVGSIDASLRAPHTDEFVLGAERRLSRTMTFEAAATVRRERSLLQSVNTGVPASSYRVIFVPDQGESYDGASDDRPLAVYDRLPSSFGQDHFTLTNPSGDTASYDGLEFTWRLSSARWFHWLARPPTGRQDRAGIVAIARRKTIKASSASCSKIPMRPPTREDGSFSIVATCSSGPRPIARPTTSWPP